VTFTWDPKKAAANARKHGVTFAEAVMVFADPLALIEPDARHEDRMVMLGLSQLRRALFVVYAKLDDEVTRLIGARRATAHERRRYEEGP
jgi:hypothetical protein